MDWKKFILILFFTSCSIFFISGKAYSQIPPSDSGTFIITPEFGTPCSKIYASGDDYGHTNLVVDIIWEPLGDNIVLKQVDLGGTGSFETTFTIPQDASPGAHTVWAHIYTAHCAPDDIGICLPGGMSLHKQVFITVNEQSVGSDAYCDNLNISQLSADSYNLPGASIPSATTSLPNTGAIPSMPYFFFLTPILFLFGFLLLKRAGLKQ